MREIAEHILLEQGKGNDTVLVTIVDSKGSTPRHIGSQMLVSREGLVCGTVGGGKVEAHAIARARELAGQASCRCETVGLKPKGEKSLGMVCGGEASLLYTSVGAADAGWNAVVTGLLSCLDERRPGYLALACHEGEEPFEAQVALVGADGEMLAGAGEGEIAEACRACRAQGAAGVRGDARGEGAAEARGIAEAQGAAETLGDTEGKSTSSAQAEQVAQTMQTTLTNQTNRTAKTTPLSQTAQVALTSQMARLTQVAARPAGRSSAKQQPACRMDGFFVMPIDLPIRAVVFGGGHVGRAVIAALSAVGFDCTLFECRPEFAQPSMHPDARQIIVGDYQDIHASLTLDEGDYVLIMTHGHAGDFAVLEQVLRQPPAYVGLMASRRKIGVARDLMEKAGVSPEAIAAVHMPIGIGIEAETPAEIAVSVAAECILHRARARMSR